LIDAQLVIDLVSNLTSKRHRGCLREWINRSNDVFLAVAFLKQSGLRHILANLRKLVARGGKLTVVVGTDFWLTEPQAIEELFNLHKSYQGCRLLMFKPAPRSTYHPKFYRFMDPQSVRVLVGSANVTNGGLSDNIEVSGTYVDTLASDLARRCAAIEKEIVSDKRCFTPTFGDLLKYQSEYSVVRKARQQIEKNTKKELSEIVSLDQATLGVFLKRYKNSAKEKADFRKRTRAYREARELIRSELAGSIDIGQNRFQAIYSRLVGERGKTKLWHSGSVFRSKNKVIPQYAKMQEMIREISRNLNRTPLQMYQLGKKWIQRIEGLGPNVFTEICNTLRPEKFAVLNKNPTTSLEKLGQGSFPAPTSFSADDYQRYCEILDRLRARCAFRDLGKTDHFLNFVYWATRRRAVPGA
jgi:HKD family nuclease